MGWLRGFVGMLFVVAVLGGIAFIAYQAGVHHSADDVAVVTAAGATVGDSGVVIVRDRGWDGFHPLGFFVFLFFGLLFFALLRVLLFGAFGRGHRDGLGERGGGLGLWGDHARGLHDEWHRASGGPTPGTPGADAGTAT